MCDAKSDCYPSIHPVASSYTDSHAYRRPLLGAPTGSDGRLDLPLVYLK